MDVLVCSTLLFDLCFRFLKAQTQWPSAEEKEDEKLAEEYAREEEEVGNTLVLLKVIFYFWPY